MYNYKPSGLLLLSTSFSSNLVLVISIVVHIDYENDGFGSGRVYGYSSPLWAH